MKIKINKYKNITDVMARIYLITASELEIPENITKNSIDEYFNNLKSALNTEKNVIDAVFEAKKMMGRKVSEEIINGGYNSFKVSLILSLKEMVSEELKNEFKNH